MEILFTLAMLGVINMDKNIKRVYRCGGNNKDLIAIQFHGEETMFITDNKKDPINKQVKELIKKLKNANTK